MASSRPATSRGGPTLAHRIGRLCSQRDDGMRNYAVTLAYWDLSRLVLAYTHAADGKGGPPSGEQGWLDAADHLIAPVLLAVEPAAQKPSDALVGEMGAILDEAYRAYRPAAAGNSDVRVLNANFCTYATWSSLTLGRDIRNRLLPYRFANLSSDTARVLATRAVVRARRANNNELARQLGHGQRTVLWEVGLSLLWLSRSHEQLDEALKGSNDCCTELVNVKPGAGVKLDQCTQALVDVIADEVGRLSIPALRNEEFHQWRRKDLYLGLASYHLARLFAKAAQHLASATLTPGGGGAVSAEWHWKLVAEMVLRGNVFIGAYEQHRIQTYLRYPVVDYGRAALFEGEPRPDLDGQEVALRRRISAQASRVFENRLNPLWERFFTDQLLVVQMGEELLRLGKDLPIPTGQAAMIPDDLVEPADTWLRQLLLRYDHSLDAETGHGTQAHMWADYDDRMSFIVNLMRSRAQLAGLWNAPFDPQDIDRISNGASPNGA